MNKHQRPVKKHQAKPILSTASHAIAHVLVFSLITMAGHIATSSLSVSLGLIGQSIAAPIGGMYWM